MSCWPRACARGCRSRCCPGRARPSPRSSPRGCPARAGASRGSCRARRGELRELLAGARETLVAYESPRRVPGTLALLAEIDPARPVAVCRELTKLHEEVVRGSAAELAARFGERRGSWRGDARDRRRWRSRTASPGSRPMAALRELVEAGARPRRAAAALAKLTGIRRQRALPGAHGARRVAWALPDVLLRHHPDLLRQRGAAPGPRLHDDRGRRDGAPPSSAPRAGLLPHRHRRARRARRRRRARARPRAPGARRPQRGALPGAARRSSARATTSSSARPTRSTKRSSSACSRRCARTATSTGHLRRLVLPALRGLQG